MATNGVIIITTKDKLPVPADYTLEPEEIPADIFARYATLDFGAGKNVVYLLNGKKRHLRKLRKIEQERIRWIKVYQTTAKTVALGYTAEDVVVEVETF